MAALFSGVCLGAALALFYMRGSSSGGTDFLTMSIKAVKPHLSIGFVTMAIDLLIILLGWPVFGNVDAVLYGLISAFVTSVVIDKIMYGMGAGKLILIITTKAEEVPQQSGRSEPIQKRKRMCCSVPAPVLRRTPSEVLHMRWIRMHL